MAVTAVPVATRLLPADDCQYYCCFYIYPWVYSSQVLKAKKVKIKAEVTIGPERRRSRKCRAEEQS